jgi:hypothetical protein
MLEMTNVAAMELVVFGRRAPQFQPDLGLPIHYTGHLHDDLSLRALYIAADMIVTSSRQDNLSKTGFGARLRHTDGCV